ncbi:MAG: butyrate kinase [Clostridia bacterium]|nr:butyrate kinase [Clostridia bacterium]
MKVLTINPGSTSTKIAVFDNNAPVFETVLRHGAGELAACDTLDKDLWFRRGLIEDALKTHSVDGSELAAVIGRGGLMRPLEGGVYKVNAAMLDDLRSLKYGDHASNLGAFLAKAIAEPLNIPAFIADPVVVDELQPMARLSGYPEIPRVSIFHALNQRAVSKRYAASIGKNYEDMNLIVAHMGGGVSVGAHNKGRIIDVNNGLDGEGPYSAERCGSLPMSGLVRYVCAHRSDSPEAIIKRLIKTGGLMGYLGTNDGREISKKAEAGDEWFRLVYEGMAYQIAKEIGACAAVLKGEVDSIILTGGFAYDELLTGWIIERVSFIAPVIVMPGEDELIALAEAALRVLNGQEEAKTY